MAFLDDTGLGHLWENIMDYVRMRGFLHAHPIGAVYITMSSANPGDTYGGVWESIGAGRTLVGVDPNDTDFNAAQKTGGNKTVNLKHSHTVNSHTHSISHTHTVNSHSHSTGNHTLTLSEIPSHSHGTSRNYMSWPRSENAPGNNTFSGWGSSTWPRVYEMSGTNSAGGGGAHNHGNTGASAPSTGGASTGSSGGASPGTTSNLPESQSIVQPYITCYFWLRTA